MNNCKKCGEQINPGEKFCRNCGEPTGQTNFLEESREGVINSEINTTPLQSNINSNQSLNNQENIYNQIPNNNINNTQKNKNSNIIPYIILSVIVVVLISVIGILIILNISKKNDNDTNHNNTNDYEENTNNDSNTTTDIDNEEDSITYKGFKFIKKSGYNYENKTSSLIISNNNYFTGITVSRASFNTLKNDLSLLEEEYKKSGVDITNLQIKIINNTEVIVGDSSVNGYKGTWYIIESSKTGYVYQGYITNRSYTINYNDVSIALSLVENAEYVGNYTNYSSDVSDLTK